MIRASLEHLCIWAMKIARYVEQFTHRSSEYIIRCLSHCPTKKSGSKAMCTHVAIYSYNLAHNNIWQCVACACPHRKRPFTNHAIYYSATKHLV